MENSDLLCRPPLPLQAVRRLRPALDARERQEAPGVFYARACLSPDFRPAKKPQGLEELIADAAKGCVLQG